MKAADGMLSGHLGRAPSRFVFGPRHRHKRKAHAVGVLEGQDRFAETLFRCLMRNGLRDETMAPKAYRTFRHAKYSVLRFAHAKAPRRDMRPRKEGENSTWLSGPVAIIEMISSGIVEIHSFLDQPKPENSRVKIQIAAGGCCNSSHVMNAIRCHG